MSISNIRIVLINTFHPGNIGAAARAMKNMGLSELYLVDPQSYPDDEASSRAAGALDVLERATVVQDLASAIADCELVIGTSARNRTFDLPLLDAKSGAEKITAEAVTGKVAILFGRETMGLLNEELRQCNFHLFIPTNPEYPVLNIAQAIQLVCYEIWLHAHERSAESSPEVALYPKQGEVQHFYQHLESVLRQTHFLIPQHEGQAMKKLERMFNRARPEKRELGMLRGILQSIEKRIDELENPDTTK
ncbi:MAG: RNA methyltransferase [Pseudomonadales bacterium]